MHTQVLTACVPNVQHMYTHAHTGHQLYAPVAVIQLVGTAINQNNASKLNFTAIHELVSDDRCIGAMLDGPGQSVTAVFQIRIAVSLLINSQLALLSHTHMHDPASTGGYCNEPDECICHFGYSGRMCDVGKKAKV